jgi:CheY-like chemotaxis protein
MAIRRFCMSMLANRGIEARVHDTTLGALGAICDHLPGLVISSVALPDLPGTSLVAALRTSTLYRALPIVILSGDTASFQLNSPHAPDALIAKDSELEANLGEFLDTLGMTKPGDDGVHAKRASQSMQGRRILLAEDCRFSQVATSRVLHVAGAEVVVVENGSDALDAVAKSQFDLVLMDIEMPVMDGREATASIRRSGSKQPILTMTGHDREEFADEAKRIGFDAVLPKMLPRGDLVRICLEHMAA